MPDLVRSLKYIVRSKKSTHYNLPTTHFKVKLGFTLIELLVVIAIIGILATFGLSSFAGAQAKARDSKRKTDLDAIKKALELYRTDSPGSAFFPRSSTTVCGTTAPACLPDDALVNSSAGYAYIKVEPKDPSGNNTNKYYYQSLQSDGTTACSAVGTGGTNAPKDAACEKYALVACLENKLDSQQDTPANTTACGATATSTFTITSP